MLNAVGKHLEKNKATDLPRKIRVFKVFLLADIFYLTGFTPIVHG